jgi:hypothetical protein
MDQDKTDLLKARLLADKKSPNRSDEAQSPKPSAAIDSAAKLTSWVLGFIAIYFAQISLFAKFTLTQPFGFWEVLALYYSVHTILKMFLQMIVAFKSK